MRYVSDMKTRRLVIHAKKFCAQNTWERRKGWWHVRPETCVQPLKWMIGMRPADVVFALGRLGWNYRWEEGCKSVVESETTA